MKISTIIAIIVITGLVIITAVILDVYRNRAGGVGAYFRRVFSP